MLYSVHFRIATGVLCVCVKIAILCHIALENCILAIQYRVQAERRPVLDVDVSCTEPNANELKQRT